MSALIYAIVQLIHTVLNLYIWIVIIAALLSFVRPDPYNPIVQILYRLTEPVMGFIRSKMPFVILSGIDLSPLVVILALQLIDNFMMRAVLGM
jgi:YggT family protein